MSTVSGIPGKTPFDYCREGDLKAIKNEIDLNGISINLADSNGNTLLHWASFARRLPVVQFLLEHGADGNIPNSTEKQTAIHWATAGGSVPVLNAIHLSGAKITVVDGRGYSPLHVAVQNGHLDLVHYFVLKGLQLDQPDNEGNTPVHWACIKNDIQILRYLSSAGANMMAVGSQGMSALHWAVSMSHVASVNFLSDKHRALTTLTDAKGRTAFEIARSRNDSVILHAIKRAETELLAMRRGLSDSNRNLLAFFASFVVYGIGMIGFSRFSFWITLLVIFLSLWGLTANAMLLMPRKEKISPAVVGFFYASFMFSLAGYAEKVTRFSFYEDPINQILFFACGFIALISHFRLVFSDPGFVDLSNAHQDAQAWMADLQSERDVKICPTCRVRRPIRAKHCAKTDRCVVRFDHYCEWISNTVGAKNHVEFLFMLGLVIICHIWSLPGFTRALGLSWNMTIGEIASTLSADPLLVYLIVFQVINAVWEASLWFSQASYVLKNMTMNEGAHHGHYPHFSRNGQFHNPFDAGSALNNLKDFLRPKMNYFHLYYLPGVTQTRLEV